MSISFKNHEAFCEQSGGGYYSTKYLSLFIDALLELRPGSHKNV